MTIIPIAGKAQCVDCDTEFFTGTEWKRIADYQDGDKVLQYNKDGTANLVYPERYIKQKTETPMFRFTTTKGVDQCLTKEHDVVYFTSKGNLAKKSLKDIINLEIQNVNGFEGRIPTTFQYKLDSTMNLTDEEIRVMCAVICDATFPGSTTRCCISLKKDRKKVRLRKLLTDANIDWREKEYCCMPGYTRFYFYAPRKEKYFSKEWYLCNQEQLKVICDEILFWDGSKNKTFSTTIFETANFVQFAFSATNIRATLHSRKRPNKKSIEHTIFISLNNCVGIAKRHDKNRKDFFKKYIAKDGHVYCFSIPSGMLVLRRNGKIFITGNSGKDTFANSAKQALEKLGYKVLITHYGDLVKYVAKTFFDWDGNKDETGRTLLQQIGTEKVRSYNENYWVEFIATMLKIFEQNWDFVLIPDTRFPNEIEYFQDNYLNLDMATIRIERPNFDNGLTLEQKQHASETALDEYKFDYIFINNSHLDDYKKVVKKFVKNTYGEKQ